MGERTKVEWCDASKGPWWGCQEVNSECDNCYAAAMDRRFHGGKHWGPGAPRKPVKSYAPDMRRWQRQADAFEAEHGHRRRVFIGPACDIFDNAVPLEWAHAALAVAEECDRLHVMLTTKRIGNLEARVPPHWLQRWPQHIGILVSVGTQATAEREIAKLLVAKMNHGIPWVGLSVEPMLEAVTLAHVRDGPNGDGYFNALTGEWFASEEGVDAPLSTPSLDWVIVGLESGAGARIGRIGWVRALVDQCLRAGVAVFVKQLGARPQIANLPLELRDAKGGDMAEWPQCNPDIRIRQFPERLAA